MNISKENLSITSLKTFWDTEKINVPNGIDEYQRDFIWNINQKKLLIDSLLRGIDIPKVYFHVKHNKKDLNIYSCYKL